MVSSNFINTLLKNKIPVAIAFNILLVSKNIRKVAQIEFYLFNYSKKIKIYLENFFVKHKINYVENKDKSVFIIFNKNIKIDKMKINDSYYIGKKLKLSCVSKNFTKEYKRKKDAPFQVRFVIEINGNKGYFMEQMCINSKILVKMHKQLTNIKKELEKNKLDFLIYMEVPPQPVYYKKRIPMFI